MTTNTSNKTVAPAVHQEVSMHPNEDDDKHKIKFDEFESETAAVVVPLDSGWAWIVMIAAFGCNVVVDGILLSSGAIQKNIIIDFNASEGYVALVSSLLTGFYLIAGPFVSALTNRYGFRLATVLGSVIAAVGFGLSYFATSVEYLFFTYGIIGGIGFSFIYIPSVIAIGYYFERWRALATGIALCGSGVGTFIFAPLTKYLIKEITWRGTLAVQAALILLCAIFGLAYRPIPPIQIEICENEDSEKDNTEKKVKDSKSTIEEPEFNVKFEKSLQQRRFTFAVLNTASDVSPYPSAVQVLRRSSLKRRLSTLSNDGNDLQNSQPTSSGQTNRTLDTVKEEQNSNENLLNIKIKPRPLIRRHTVGTDLKANNQSLTGDSSVESRPLYRDDIFFSGPLARIPQYTSQTSLAYHMSVTRLPSSRDLQEQKEPGFKFFPEAVKRTLLTMLHLELLKSPSFMLLATSGFLTMMGFFIPFIFLERRALKAGMDENTANLIISIIGITNTIARILCGLLTSFKFSALLLNNVTITAGGIATILSGFVINKGTQFTYAVVFGICAACFTALRSIMAVELMGLEKLTNAFGFLMLFQGVAAAVGAPIAGMFYDLTGSYDASFWFAGALITISAIICYPLNYVNKWEKRRESKKDNIDL